MRRPRPGSATPPAAPARGWCARRRRGSRSRRAARSCAGRATSTSASGRARPRRAARGRRRSRRSTTVTSRPSRTTRRLADRRAVAVAGRSSRSRRYRRLVLEEEDGVVVLDGAAQQAVGVGDGARADDLEPGHADEPALRARGVERAAADAAAVRAADHERDADAAAPVRLGGAGDDGVERAHTKSANCSSTIGRSPIQAAPTAAPTKPSSAIGVSITRSGAELLEQALGDAERRRRSGRRPRPSGRPARPRAWRRAGPSWIASRYVIVMRPSLRPRRARRP